MRFFFQGDDLLEFHQAVVSTLRDADEAPVPLDPAPLPTNIPPTNPLMTHTSEDLARLSEIHTDLGTDQNDDETSDNGDYILLFISFFISFSFSLIILYNEYISLN